MQWQVLHAAAWCARWGQPLCQMLWGLNLPMAVVAYQQALIRRRLVVAALLWALLAAAWVPVDALYLSRADFIAVAAWRLVLIVGLGAVAGLLWRDVGWLGPRRALLVYVTLQCVTFAAMLHALSADAPLLLQAGYGFFPFVVVAQLALFPLPVAYSLLLASPVVVLYMATAMGGASFVLPVVSALWLLGLIFVVACWSSAMQLSLLVSLLSARNDAAHDALTGLPNRRSAMARLHADASRASRAGEPLAVLVFDLDHFKRVNDEFGHAAGDEVLVALADVVRAQLRASDLAARTGGEEFLVILPGADEAQACAVAERMRQRIELAEVPRPHAPPIKFTASIGVALWQPDETVEAWLARGDEAMYAAKNSGRNRVCMAAVPRAGAPNHTS